MRAVCMSLLASTPANRMSLLAKAPVIRMSSPLMARRLSVLSIACRPTSLECICHKGFRCVGTCLSVLSVADKLQGPKKLNDINACRLSVLSPLRGCRSPTSAAPSRSGVIGKFIKVKFLSVVSGYFNGASA